MCFLGMTGYYRKFCRNFSSVAAPLTDLLRKDQAYVWYVNCDKAFTKIKALITLDCTSVSDPTLLQTIQTTGRCE